MSGLRKLLPYFRYLRPVWWRFGLGILFGVLYSVSSGLGLPIMAETIFPVLFGNEEKAPDWLADLVHTWFANDIQGGFLILCCLFMPFMMLLRAAGAVGNGYYMTYAGVHVIQSIQTAVFEKVQSLPLAFFYRYKTGEVMAAIMGYPNQIKQVVVDTSNDLVKQPLTLLSAVGFLIYKSFSSNSFFVAVIGVLSVPLVVFPIRKIGRYLAKRARQLVTTGEDLNSATIESIQSPVEIRAYNLQERQVERFRERLRQIFHLTVKSVRSSLLISPSIEVVAAAGLALALFLGVRTGMSEGEFMALGVALYMAYTPVKRLGRIHGSLKALEAPMQRLEAILNEPETVGEPERPRALPSPVQGALRFESVDFSYEGSRLPALQGIDISIRAGERIGLVGQSGGGKSTFVNLIPRFFDPAAGTVRLDGVDLRELPLADLRAAIAYVPQMPLLFNASVAENIRLSRPGASDEAIREAARQAAADTFISALPHGYDTVLSERGNSLSGGQRQRIAIARAFLRDAPILILDEATSALDNEADAEIQETIERLSRNRTTLVVAHRLNTLDRFKRRLYFESGRIAGDGSHEELLESCPGYRRLCNLPE